METRLHLFILSLITVVTTYADPIQISVTASARDTALGYTAGNEYTFNWVVNEGYAGNPLDGFTSDINRWMDASPLDSQLFSNLSGDGITGSYVKSSYPLSYVAINNDLLYLTCTDENEGALGIQVNGDNIISFSASFLITTSFSYPEAYVDPTTYLSSYIVTYAPPDSGEVKLRTENGSIYFDYASTTIQTIPEPSSLVLVLTGAAGVWFTRRRLKR